MRSWVFWGVMQCRLVVPYRRFWDNLSTHLQGSSTQRRIVHLDGTQFVAMFVKAFPHWLWLWLYWYEGWQAQQSAPVGQIIWSRGLYIALHRYVLVVVLWLWIYWCHTLWLVTQSHSPPPTPLSSMFQSAWNITLISQVLWSASTICLESFNYVPVRSTFWEVTAWLPGR